MTSRIYVPLAGGAQLADQLSRGVYKLSQPDGVRPASYSTTRTFGWIAHPETGAVALALNESYLVPLHMAADPAPLLDLLESLKDDFDQPLITSEERDALIAAVQQYAGKRIPLPLLIPERAQQGVMTEADLASGGWLALPPLPSAD
jgi:hypothetical protein